MAHLRCDYCGGSTTAFGSWDTPITIICKKCEEKRKNSLLEDKQ